MKGESEGEKNPNLGGGKKKSRLKSQPSQRKGIRGEALVFRTDEVDLLRGGGPKRKNLITERDKVIR